MNRNSRACGKIVCKLASSSADGLLRVKHQFRARELVPLEFRVLKDCEEAESLSAAVAFCRQIAMVLRYVETPVDVV